MGLCGMMSKDALDALNDACVPLLSGVPCPDPTRCPVERLTSSMGTPGGAVAIPTSQLKSKFKPGPCGVAIC